MKILLHMRLLIVPQVWLVWVCGLWLTDPLYNLLTLRPVQLYNQGLPQSLSVFISPGKLENNPGRHSSCSDCDIVMSISVWVSASQRPVSGSGDQSEAGCWCMSQLTAGPECSAAGHWLQTAVQCPSLSGLWLVTWASPGLWLVIQWDVCRHIIAVSQPEDTHLFRPCSKQQYYDPFIFEQSQNLKSFKSYSHLICQAHLYNFLVGLDFSCWFLLYVSHFLFITCSIEETWTLMN